MRGGGAAAAAHDGRASRDEVRHVGGEFLRSDREHGLSVHDLRHAGVGFDGDGTRNDARKAFHVGAHLVRTEPAVEAKRVHAQALQERGHAFHVAAREELAVFAKRDSGDHGQVAVLLCGEDGRLEFVGVAHRLDHHEVGARRRAEAHLFGEGVIRGVEFEVAGGLEQTAGGANVKGNVVCASRRFGDGDAGGDDIRKRCITVVLRRVRAEGVGVDHVRARREVGGVDGAVVVGARQVPQLGNLAGGESACLELRPHASVEEQGTPDWQLKHHSSRRRAVSRAGSSRG